MKPIQVRLSGLEEGTPPMQGQAAPPALKSGWRGLFWHCRLRPCAIAILTLLLMKLCFTGLVVAWPALYRAAQNTFRVVYYGTDPMLFGRNEASFPAPSCCREAACALQRGAPPRLAALTSIRSDNYLPLLQQMECSFRKSNREVELAVMTVRGELGAGTRQWLQRSNLTLVEVEALYYKNSFTHRYGRNWLKLRALELTQYDAIVFIDSDTVVVGDVTPLFSLPTEFAAVWDQNKWLGRFNTRLPGGINSGVMLLRPCPAVLQHMLGLLDSHPKLRFSHAAAEQDFLSWYYRYAGMMLPLEYNAMASDSLRGNLTIGGRSPVIVHFTQHKPFRGPVRGQPGHQFLCAPEELR